MIMMTLSIMLAGVEPTWWTTRPHLTDDFVGVGAGADLDAARLRAIVDLVESLAVDVSSRRRSTTTETSVNGAATLTDSFEQELNTSTNIRNLPGLALVAQATDGGVHYAQVRVAAAVLLPELARRCVSLVPAYVPPPTPPTWAWATNARRELAILRERERLTTILASHGEPAPAAPVEATRMATDLGVLAVTSQVQVAGPAGSELDGVMAALGRCTLTQSSDAALALVVSVADTRTRTDRGWHQVQKSVSIEVRSRSGTVIGQMPCLVSGTSTKDAAGADQAALVRLGPALDTLFADQLLPLLLSHHLE